MDITITPQKLSGTLPAIASKSEAHRLLICAALADTETELEISGGSVDIEATASCLSALGAGIEAAGESRLRVTPLRGAPSRGAILDCVESGSTLRFLLPVAAALGAECRFTGSGRLPSRPLAPLPQLLRSHGASLDSDRIPLKLGGKLKGGGFSLPGNISSQFFTGLLLALPLAGGGEVVAESPLESRGYVDITLAAMRLFGVDVAESEGRYLVPAHPYLSPGAASAGGDWSNAAFWLCLGALSGPISVTGLDINSVQGDRAVLKILREFGADVTVSGGTVTVSGGNLRGIDIDASDIPDLIPVLSVVSAAATGVTKIFNAQRLRLKESDRLGAICENLALLGADIEETEDGLLMRGGRPLRGGCVSGWGDHRMVMSSAVAAQLCEGPVTITGCEAVSKSYPNFFSDLEILGGKINVK